MTIDRVKQYQGEQHFAAAVTAELPGLYRFARSITTNQAEAEDLVGDTVVRAIERQAQYRGEASLRTWLHQILSHLAVDRARHQAHELSVEDVETLWRDQAYSVDAEAVVESAESAEELRDALVHLPQHYRSVIVLHDAEGWPASQIAAVLGISLPAAKQRLRRARMILVSALAHGRARRAANTSVPLSCWDAREQVSGYLDGDLDASARAALEVHLANCATCPPLFQALAGVRASLGAFHDPDSVVPAELAGRVRAHLAGAQAPGEAPNGEETAQKD